MRPNHRLYDLIEKDVISHKPAELHGARMYIPEGFWFPVICMTNDQNDVVYGDLLLCRDGETVREVVKMEMQAGYRMKANFVWCEETMVRATSFVYMRIPENSTQITSGDWSDWERAETTLDF